MKIAVLLILLVTCYASSEESVLNLLRDLKKNADLELETLEIAWQRRLQNKQEVLESLNSQLINQRAECQSKSDDVKQKVEDIENTSNYINWMLGRQKINIKRIDVLTANRCRQTNNYVNDVKNHKIALQLVYFLRSELQRLDGASFADVSRYNEKVNKFLKIYQSGKLLNMVEKMHMKDGHLEIPEIFEALDINEDILKSSRILLQQAQDDSDSAADNTVVLIPGCDNTVGTVVVVQNDDGTSDSGNDAKITFSNGGGQSNSNGGKGPGSKTELEKILDGIESDDNDDDEEDNEDDEDNDDDDSSSEESGSGDSETSNGESKNSDNEDDSDSEGQSETGDNSDEDNGDDEDDSAKADQGDDSDDGDDEDNESGDNGDNDQEDDGESQNDDDSEGDNSDKNKPDNGSKAKDVAKGKESEAEDEEEGEPTTFQEVLDALEKHIKKQLDVSQNDEVRSSLGFIDFKLHVELENGTFDKQINHETEYSIKQNNQLKGRQQALVLCGARLKQLNVAIKLANDDLDAAKKYYLSQKQLKTEEVQTFDEVYDIYVQSTK